MLHGEPVSSELKSGAQSNTRVLALCVKDAREGRSKEAKPGVVRPAVIPALRQQSQENRAWQNKENREHQLS